MPHKTKYRPPIIRLPNGALLTPDDLPPAHTRHWVASRKLKVVLGLHYGVISETIACKRYNISVDELRSWQRSFLKHGKNGLKSTKLGCYRFKNIGAN